MTHSTAKLDGRRCVRCGFLPLSHHLGTPGACHRYEKPASPSLKALSATLDHLVRHTRKD